MTDPTHMSIENRLKELKTPPPGADGFRDALRQRLLEDASTQTGKLNELSWLRRHPILVGVLSGVVTAVLILFAASQFMFQSESGPPSSAQSLASIAAQEKPTNASEPKKKIIQPDKPTHRVPSRRVALIKFHFSSEVAVTDVDMRIQLPSGLKFWSQGKELVQSQVAWMSNLKPGVNTVPVAVYALAAGRYDVVATAQVEGKTIRHKVVLEVIDDA